MDETFVRLRKLPTNVKGFTLRDEDGNYNIYVNDSLFVEEQEEVVRHEKKHIINGDFDSDFNLIFLEHRAG